MLENHKALRSALIFLAAIFVSLAIFLFGETFSSSFETCVNKETANESQQASKEYDSPISIIGIRSRCTAGFIRSHNGEITALATLIMAAFTGTLWWAAAGQYDLLEKQIDLARDEFISSHRPKIIVHSVELAYDANEQGLMTLGAEITIFNIGGTSATITDFVGNIQIRETPLRAGIILPTIEISPIIIGVGERKYLRVGSVFDDRSLNAATRGAQGNPLLCIAAFVYRDANETPRFTGLCRRYSAASGQGRWHKYVSPEAEIYEYAY